MQKLFSLIACDKTYSFFLKKVEKGLGLVLIVCSSLFSLVAQEHPPIQNFSPVDYQAQNQNWGIDQSDEGNIYVANNDGLLEFNGAIWQLYGSPNGSTIRSVKVVGNRVYTGCYMEFGFWMKNSRGEQEYHSISEQLELSLKEDEEFWNILELDQWVLFQSLERIYIYNVIDHSVKVVDSQSTKAQIFDVQGTIYHHSLNKGLYKIEDGVSKLVSDHPIIKSSIVSGIFLIDNKPLLVTENGDFYFFENEILEPWKKVLNEELTALNVYSSLQLHDGSILLGTISNGIYCLSNKGEIRFNINQENGLNNNTVLSIFEDVDHNLWLALDNGISAINMDSPFNEYIDKNGKLGVVYAAAKHNNYLYLGTNQGLFYKPVDGDQDFIIMPGTEGQVWVLKTIDEVLFCGHNNGTYIVEADKTRLISSFPGTWDIKPIPNQNNLLLQGNFNGLSVLSKTDTSWGFRNTIDGFNISSRFFEFLEEDKVLVNREFKGVFELNFDADFTKVVGSRNASSRGIGASMVSYMGEILYACNNGIFRYDSEKTQLVADTLMTNVLYRGGNKPLGIFIQEKNEKRLWSFTDRSIMYTSPGKFSKRPEINEIVIPSSVRKNLGILGFENLTPLSKNKYLVGITNGYLTLDLNKLITKEYVVRIDAISNRSSNSNSSTQKVALDSTATFEFLKNNISFAYSVPDFNKYTEANYQYRLSGMNDAWSEWSSTSSNSFENLPFGNYNFEVRARVADTITDNVASYQFRIERPWYLSNIAIFFYVLAFVLLAILIHKLYKNYYKKQQQQLLKENKKKLKRKELKAQKKIVQIKNEKLIEEVESKNRELAISTMSIIKKNEFLNAIKDQLKGEIENPRVKAVIRTIDRNINNVDDWKFFEDAFNNADKDFLKKIKGIHPELTPNDLRLCAYLRLNLSSKEIAPLLNISVRSVEVKRYRLRKKIQLPHEDGLIDYIMHI